MSMFDKYEDNSYTAYNISPVKIATIAERYLKSPIVGYDKYHNVKEFIWDPEDQFTLNISAGVKVRVLDNSIIYESTGSAPTSETRGVKGQRAYNTIDGKSWLCKGTVAENVVEGDWIPLGSTDAEELPEWTPLSVKRALKSKSIQTQSMDTVVTTDDAGKSSYIWEEDPVLIISENGTKQITVYPNMKNSSLKVAISNFRHEVLYEYVFDNSLQGSIRIDKEVTPELVEGQFFLDTYVITSDTVFQETKYNITIVENPSKYRFGTDITSGGTDIYKFQSTIQTQHEDYIWESLGPMNSDYIWIPLSNDILQFDAKWIKLQKED